MSASTETAAARPPMMIVDLGKQKRSRIKKLRKGEGSLMERVQGVMEELRQNGSVGENAQPVVIVVREKEELPGLLSGLLR